MNKKINTICFIILFIFLICTVSAADNNNETLTNIKQPDTNQAICKISIENNTEKLTATNTVKQTATKSSKVTPVAKKEKITLKAPNIKMHYKDGTKFKVTVKDKNKKAIQKLKLKISINGKTYQPTTDTKGTASINLNLNSGTYTVLTSFAGNSKYESKSMKSTVTIKSTIKCSDFSKFYKNNAAYYSTFYDKKGKLLKNTAVKLKLNSKTYSVKTDKKGVAKLSIDAKPGTYKISSINSKTSETITKTITIKSILETKDLTMNDGDGSKFNVKVLNCYGKASPNKKVTLKVNGKTYTATSDKNGIASLPIDLDVGKYSITSEYEGLKNTNYITVNKVIKTSQFKYTTLIPNYVNVTVPYVFKNSAYSLKSGTDGIIKMPKVELFNIQIGSKNYQFSTEKIGGIDSTVIGYKSYLIPFDGSEIQSEYNKDNLKGSGIIISQTVNYTQIDYQSKTSDSIELFGAYADADTANSETITYMQNDKITAKVNFQTQGFDETGLRYSLAKFYGKQICDFNSEGYEKILGDDVTSIKFANTNLPVTFSYFGHSIIGTISKEDIITKLYVNGKEELEKQETISYGLGENYRRVLGFEVLQSFSIINEKVSKEALEKWVNANNWYLSKFGVMNVYGMHLASLETAWLADELADSYAKDFEVSWKRSNTLTILGGINLEDTYLHILNADMGMKVSGTTDNVKLFRLMNSIYLPYLEDYSLSYVSKRYMDNSTNSLDNILSSIDENKFNIVQFGEMFYIICENGKNSTIVINSTSGISNVIMENNGFTYKGAAIKTTKDCCGVGIMPKDIILGIRNSFDILKTGNDVIDYLTKKAHPLCDLIYDTIGLTTGIASRLGSTSLTLGLASTIGLMISIHTFGNKFKNNFVEKKDWHYAYEHVTFTRDGLLQNKKFYNIPKKDGTYDYVEVGINDDGSLNRNDVLYVSEGSVKKLTKSESYKYFDEEYWSPFNIPKKYQKYPIS